MKNWIDSSYIAPRSLSNVGKWPLALLVELIEVVNVQPLAGELGGEPARLAVADHATGLRQERVGLVELAGCRDP